MRSIHPALRATATVAIVAALSAGLAGNAQAGSTRSKKPGGTIITTATTTTALTASQIKSLYDQVCPTVVEYTSCARVSVTVADFGATGWAADSSPATGTVRFNSHLTMGSAGWAQAVSHEMGGHHDAWNEIVAKVGTTQAWTDYYDLDYFGQKWATSRYLAVTGTSRSFTTVEGKEIYLDCVGSVAHGYPAAYLSSRGVTSTSQQTSFCQGASTVMSDALTKVRPS